MLCKAAYLLSYNKGEGGKRGDSMLIWLQNVSDSRSVSKLGGSGKQKNGWGVVNKRQCIKTDMAGFSIQGFSVVLIVVIITGLSVTT